MTTDLYDFVVLPFIGLATLGVVVGLDRLVRWVEKHGKPKAGE